MNRACHRRRAATGFSLIEIMIVLGILAIVAGVALPTVGKSMERSRIVETRGELAALQPAITAYFEDTGVFPPSFEDLVLNASGVPGWAGSYLVPTVSGQGWVQSSLALDAWNRSYAVTVTGDSRLTITSAGPNGAFGDGDDIVQDVDVTPVRRARTLTELRTINTAVTAWNALNLPDNPLPGNYPALLSALVAGGFLPGGTTTWETDAWGDGYVPDPPGASPIVAVTSVNVSPWVDAPPGNGPGNGPGNSPGNSPGNGPPANPGNGPPANPGKPPGTPGKGSPGG